MTNRAHLENRLRDYMAGFPVGHDVPILTLYIHMYGDSTNRDDGTPRTIQQYVGGIVSRVNTKLERDKAPYRIKPGKLKRTYCRTNDF